MPNPEAREKREKRIEDLYKEDDYKEAYHRLLYTLRRCSLNYDRSCGKRTVILRAEDYENDKNEDVELLLDLLY